MRLKVITGKDSNYKMSFIDILFLFTILFQDAGDFGFLPLNAYQVIILFLGMVLVLCKFYKNINIKLSKRILLLLSYMFGITLLFGGDFESFKGLLYFALHVIILFFYIETIDDYKKLLKLIYIASFILASYGIIQEIAYILGIPEIYDTTLYGFKKNGSYITASGIFRTVSLYAEPAHLSSIIAAGVFIGLIGKNECYEFTSTIKTFIIVLFGVLTISTIVYISVLIIVLLYIFLYQKNLLRKIWLLLLFFCVGYIFIKLNPKIMSLVYEKLGSLKTGSSTMGSDLSAFALYSNIKVAIEKMKDGYLLGTGYDTHRIYYFDYIDYLYSNVLIYANVDEAASLFTRILSEFGIFGFIGFFFFMFTKFVRSIKNKNVFTLFLVLILFVQGIRNGHYPYILSTLPFVILVTRKWENYD